MQIIFKLHMHACNSCIDQMIHVFIVVDDAVEWLTVVGNLLLYQTVRMHTHGAQWPRTRTCGSV